MKTRSRKTRLLAWLLCAGITVTSMPESFLYGAEFTDGSEMGSMSPENVTDEQQNGSTVSEETVDTGIEERNITEEQNKIEEQNVSAHPVENGTEEDSLHVSDFTDIESTDSTEENTDGAEEFSDEKENPGVGNFEEGTESEEAETSGEGSEVLDGEIQDGNLNVADATVEVVWSDLHDQAERRPQNAEELFEIYADGVPVDSSQYEVIWKEKDVQISDTLDVWTAEITGLPVYKENEETAVSYTVMLNEEKVQGYTKMEAKALGSAPSEVLETIAAPDEELQLTLDEENNGTYLSKKKFGVYLPVYDVSGTIRWSEGDQTAAVRPEMEEYFASQFLIKREREGYSNAKVIYSQDESDPDLWHFSVDGLFATKEDGSSTYYIIEAQACEGYRLDGAACEITADTEGIAFAYSEEEAEEIADAEVVEIWDAEPEAEKEGTPDVSADEVQDETEIPGEEQESQTPAFSVTKKWLDNTEVSRPEAVLKLYRKIEGSETEEPVLYENENQVQWTLKTSKINKRFNDTNTSETIVSEPSEVYPGATLPDGGAVQLPELDESHNQYTYYVREFMADTEENHYKGYVADGPASDVKSGTTLYNRIEENLEKVTEDITWVAAEYEEKLGNVSVTMTLQCRRADLDSKGAPVYAWENVKVDGEADYTRVVSGFGKDNMTRTVASGSVPQYDNEGHKLEYRWIQTGISEGNQTCALNSGKDVDGDGIEDSYFQLPEQETIQNGEEYIKTYIIPEGLPYAGRIINRLVGNTSYKINKVWDENIPSEERGDSLAVRLEQRDSSGRIVKIWENVTIPKSENGNNWELTVTKVPDGKGGFEKIMIPDEEGQLQQVPDRNGGYLETPLPKYDSNGSIYRYYAIEDETRAWIASYEGIENGVKITNTKREALDKESEIIDSNGTASAQLIWRDISEKKHTIEHLPVRLRYKVGDGQWGIVECEYKEVTIEGNTEKRWVPKFTEAQKKALGISDESNITVKESGENELNRTLSVSGLPSVIKPDKHEESLSVKWDLRLAYSGSKTYVGIDKKEAEGNEPAIPETSYIIEQKTLDGQSVVTPGNRIYHLTPTMDFSVDLDIRNGYDTVNGTQEEYFEWFTSLTINGKTYRKVADIVNDYPTAKVNWKWTGSADKRKAKLLITGLPWCDDEKGDTAIYVSYHKSPDNKFVGDYVENYDNSKVPNYGSCTKHVHNGGTLILTRTGITDFSATKMWLDDNLTKRPKTTWSLWRYTNKKGVSYQDAAQVRDQDGKVIQWELKTSETDKSQNDRNKSETVSISDDPSKGTRTEPVNTYAKIDDLPKYDSDGYEYIYFVKEEMEEGNHYEQFFGTWNETEKRFEGDRLPEDISKRNDSEHKGETILRENAGNSLFMGGTLTNRATGTVTAQQKKMWQAENYQSDLSEVIVEMTLQSRVVETDSETGENPNPWENVQKDGENFTQELTEFKTEIPTQEASASGLPQYDENGRTLEYQWVETAVYENSTDKKNGINKLNLENGEIKFQLNIDNDFDGKENFISSVEKVNINGQEEEVVVNRLVGRTDYLIQKTWDASIKEQPDFITVDLEQRDSEENLIQIWKNIKVKKEDQWLLYIDKVPDGNGGFTDIPLPKYDEDGEKYIYVAVEQAGSEEWTADYEYNIKDPNSLYNNFKEGYHNVRINNGPGIRKRIRVRKKWLDDGDSTQRKPVKIEVWRKLSESSENDVLVAEVTLDGSQDWMRWVDVTEYQYEENNQTIISSKIKNGWENDIVPDNNETYAELKKDELSWRKDHFYDVEKYGWSYYIREATVNSVNVSAKEEDLSPGGYPTVTTGENAFKYEVIYPVQAVTEPVGDKMVTVGGGKDGEYFYTVMNRRIGVVNLTVTKEWIDGGKTAEERKALGASLVLHCEEYSSDGAICDRDSASGQPEGYVKLPDIQKEGEGEFHDTYSIYEYPILDSVENPVSSRQSIGNTTENENTEIVYFWNLPKYDAKGAIVHYNVKEEDTYGKLSAGDYTISIVEGNYTVQQKVSHTIDTQDVTVTNQRADTLDVKFHKKWIDQSVFEEHNRPDISLTLYRAIKDKNGTVGTPEATEYIDRKWDKESDDSNYYWTCTFSDMPRYSPDGEEYVYYASEKVEADKAVLDYVDVQYAHEKVSSTGSAGSATETVGKAVTANMDPNYRGPEFTELTYLTELSYGKRGGDTEPGYYVNYSEDSEGWVKLGTKTVDTGNGETEEIKAYVLREDGTFVNEIRKDITIQGKKVWENIPFGFPRAELPDIEFVLYQTAADGTKEKIAEINEITKKDLSFNFVFKYQGVNSENGKYKGELSPDPGNGSAQVVSEPSENTVPDSTDQWEKFLPKYDCTTGSLYTYSVEEKIHGTDVGDIDITYIKAGETQNNSYIITNTYRINGKNKQSLTVKKNWSGVSDIYPETEFILYRFYETADGYHDAEEVGREKLTSIGQDDQVVFLDLPIYAPSDKPYIYFLKETAINGYKTEVEIPAGVVVTKTANKENWPEQLGGNDEKDIQPGYSPAFKLVRSGSSVTPVTVAENNNADGAVVYTNTYQQPEIDYVSLEGTKTWDDYSDQFNTRPDNLYLKVYRWAERQSDAEGTDNAIGSKDAPVYVGYATVPKTTASGKIQWMNAPGYTRPVASNTNMQNVECKIALKDTSSDSWTYTFSNLERYAPNGNPWIYKVVETANLAEDAVPDHYTEANGGVATQTKDNGALTDSDKTLTMSELINKSEKVTVKAKKEWTLLVNLERPSVVFALQVKEGENGEWKWAEEYFENHSLDSQTPYLFTQRMDFTYNLEGDYTEYRSAVYYSNLPKGIVTNRGYQEYQYRVKEVQIGIISSEVDPSTGKLTRTQEMQNVQFGSGNSTTVYPIQSSDSAKLYPGVEYAANQPDNIQYVISPEESRLPNPEEKDEFDQEFTIKNTPRGQNNNDVVDISITKNWEDDNDAFDTRGNWTVYFGLYRKIENGPEEIVRDTNGDQWSFFISDQNNPKSLPDLPKYKCVNVNGENTYSEYTYYVKELTKLAGDPIENGHDVNGNKGYVVSYAASVEQGNTFNQTVTNNLKTTKLEFTKIWKNDFNSFRPTDLEWGTDISLFRGIKADGTDAIDVTEFVVGEKANISQVNWDKTTGNTVWKCTIEKLPYCDAAGEPYYYFVQEKTQDGYLNPVASPNTLLGNGSEQSPYTQSMSLTNTATQFKLDKIAEEGQTKLNNVGLTFTGSDNSTAGWTLEWNRDAGGNESYTITDPVNKKRTEGATGAVTITGLPLGSYVLTGETVPYGYETAADKEITITLETETVEKDGIKSAVTKLKVSESDNVSLDKNNHTIAVKDDKQMLVLKKVDTENNELASTNPPDALDRPDMSFAIKGIFAKSSSEKELSEGIRYLFSAPSDGKLLEAGELIATKFGETDENKKFIYTLTEVKAPKGYVPLGGDVQLTFTMSEEGKIQPINFATGEKYADIASADDAVFTLKNAPIKITIIKSALSGGTLLPGAEFTLAKWNGSVYVTLSKQNAPDSDAEKIITGENGTVTLEVPDWDLECNGQYRLTETKASDGYILYNRPIYFKINERGEIETASEAGAESMPEAESGRSSDTPMFEISGVTENCVVTNTITVKNEPIHIVLTKNDMGYDNGGNDGIGDSFNPPDVLKDVEFTLTNKDDNKDVQKKKTNGNGQLVFGPSAKGTDADTYTFAVKGGNVYTLQETVPNGYTGLQTPIDITVGTDGIITIPGSQNEIVKTDIGSDDSVTDRVTVKNTRIKGKLKVVKRDPENLLSGVQFTLKDWSGKQINNGVKTTDKNGEAVWENLEWGTYQLEETWPDGFVPTEVKTIRIGIGTNESLDVNAEIANYKNQLTVQKSDEDGNPLLGAEFALFAKKSDNTYDNVEGFDKQNDSEGSETGKYYAEGLPAGEYKLVETKAPAGYKLPENEDRTLYLRVDNSGKVTITRTNNRFTIKGNETVIAHNIYDNCITMKDEPIQAEIQKVDAEGNPLSGAEFTVTGFFAGENGLPEATEKTITLPDNGSFSLSGMLVGGKSYQITEIKAPAGCKKPVMEENKPHFIMNVRENGVITVAENPDANLNGTTIRVLSKPGSSSVKKVQIIDAAIDFKLKKTDSEGNVIPGITFTLKPESGKTFADAEKSTELTLVSGTDGILMCGKNPEGFYSNEEFMKLLYAGDTYTLHEVVAEASPYVALTKAVTFTIELDGTLSVPAQGSPNYCEAVTVIDQGLTLKITNTETSVKIAKIGSEDHEALAGAELEIYHLSSGDWDSDNVCPASGSKPLRSWVSEAAGAGTSDAATVTITGLPTGKYVLYEKEAPEGYDTFEPVYFALSAKNEITILSKDQDRVIVNGETEGSGAGAKDIQLVPPSEGENTYKIIMTDTKIRGHFKITKKLGNSNLGGVKFDLYKVTEDDAGILLASITTTEDGTWDSKEDPIDGEGNANPENPPKLNGGKGLEAGTYYLVETQTSNEAYLPDRNNANSRYTFTINASNYKDESGYAYEETITNTPFTASLSLKKIDGTSGNAVNGAKFQARYAETKGGINASTEIIPFHMDTDITGTASITFSKKGYYQIEEISAEGYTGDFQGIIHIQNADHNKSFNLTNASDLNYLAQSASDPAWNDVTTAGIPNERSTGQVTLVKADSVSYEKLNGVTFRLEKSDSSTERWNVVASGTTGHSYDVRDLQTKLTASDGTLTFTGLEWGTYKLSEAISKPGYTNQTNLSENNLTFVIDRNNLSRTIGVETDEHGLLILNTKNVLKIRKTNDDEVETKYLVGAEFSVLNEKEQPVTDLDDSTKTVTGVTDENGTLTFTGKLTAGMTYLLRETKAPAGYELNRNDIKFRMNADGTITLDGNVVPVDPELTVQNHPIEIILRKKGADTDGKLISSSAAAFELYKEAKNGEEEKHIATVSTNNGTVKLDQDTLENTLLEVDTVYRLEETNAPDGYKVLEQPLTFKVDTDGKVVELKGDGAESENDVITITDEPTFLDIIKTGTDGTIIEERGFAKFKVTPVGNSRFAKSKEAFIEVTSNDLSRLSGELIAGKTYELCETEAPKGYKLLTKNYTFELDKNGNICKIDGIPITGTENADTLLPKDLEVQTKAGTNKLYIKDSKTGMSLTKAGLTGMESIEGDVRGYAVFTVSVNDPENNAFADGTTTAITGITSQNIGRKLEGLLIAETTYVLTETKAPAGYKLAAPVKFQLNLDGTIKLDGTTSLDGISHSSSGLAEAFGTALTVRDEPIDVKLIKTDAQTGDEVSGAVFTVKPYESDDSLSSEDVKNRFVSEDKTVITVNSSVTGNSNPTGLEGELIAGHTYVITETTAPNGYELAEDVFFTVDENGHVEILTKDGEAAGENSAGTAVNGDTIAVKIADAPIKAKIIKIDANNPAATLESAEFSLSWNVDGQRSERDLVTGEDGTVKIPAGILVQNQTYILTETKAPEGYQLPTENPSLTFTVGTDGRLQQAEGTDSEIFSINKENGISVISVKNKKTELQILKISNEKPQGQNVLFGAELEIYELSSGWDSVNHRPAENSRFVRNWTSKETAETITGLPAGDYVLYEKKAPDGFTIAEPIHFTLSVDNTVTASSPANAVTGPDEKGVYTITMTDTVIRGHVSLRKTLTDGTTPVEGAVFSLYKVNPDGEDVEVASNLTTNRAGIWSSEDNTQIRIDTGEPLSKGLEKGSYYFKETAVPADIKLDAEKKWNFSITDTDHEAIVSVDAKNDTFEASVIIKKTEDAAHEYQPVENAAFDLYYNEKEEVHYHVTEKGIETNGQRLHWGILSNGNGEIRITDLKKGHYLLIETSNMGYDPESFFTNGAFTIEEADYGKDLYLTVENGKLKKSKTPAGDGQGIINTRLLGSMTLKKVDGSSSTKDELKDVSFCLEVKHTTDGRYVKIPGMEELKTGTTYTILPDGEIMSEENKTSPGTLTIRNLDWAMYRITEVKALPGYVNPKISMDFSITRDGDKDVLLTSNNHEIYNEQNYVRIKKIDAANEEILLNGAKFEVLDENGVSLDPPVIAKAADGTVEIQGILEGGKNYILRETEAPVGYKLAEDIHFTMEEDGTVRVGGRVSDDKYIVVKDKKIQVTLQKADFVQGTAAGRLITATKAYFNLYEKDTDTPVQKDISTDGGKVVLTDLTKDTVYRLEETKAPEGYELADAILFKVDANGNVVLVSDTSDAVSANGESLTVEDKKISIDLVKEDLAGTEITGRGDAEFEVEGKFVTEKSPVTVTVSDISEKLKGELVAEEFYTVTEQNAPEGYELTQPFRFQVNTDGTVKIVSDDTEAVRADEDTIHVKDAPITVSLTKTALNGNGTSIEVDGGTNTTTGRGYAEFTIRTGKNKKDHFADGSQGTLQRDGKPVEFTSQNIGETLEGLLVPGCSYVLTETKAPDGYELAAEMEFSVDKYGNIRGTESDNIVVEDTPIELSLVKIDAKTKEPLDGAVFTVEPVQGSRFASSGTGSTMPDSIEVSGSETLSAVLIAGNRYLITEKTAPDGYELAGTVTFEVAANGEVKIVETEGTPSAGTVINGTVVKIEIADESIEAELVKVDSDGTTPLAGVHFALYEGEKPVKDCEDLVTGEVDGRIMIPAGVLVQNHTYRLEETKPAAGYQLPDKKPSLTFTVKTDGTLTVDRDDMPPTEEDGTLAQPDSGKVYFHVDNTGKKIVITISNARTKVLLDKVSNETGERIAGAKLQILKDKKVVAEWISDGKEAGRIEGLAPGTYTLHEEEVPDGYLAAEDISFILKENNTISGETTEDSDAVSGPDQDGVYKLTMTDTCIRGHVKLTKTVKDSGLFVEHAVFDLYRKADAPDGKDVRIASGLTTDKNGVWTSEGSESLREDKSGEETLSMGLEKGTYYFVETSVPVDVKLDETTHWSFSIKDDSHEKVVPVSAVDEKFGAEAVLKKTEDEAHQFAPIAGAVFELYYNEKAPADDTGKPYAELVSGEDGMVIASGLQKGFYILKEVSNTGYDADSFITKTFEIKDEDSGQTINLTQDATAVNLRLLGSMTLKKVDGDTKEELAGVTFKLQRREAQSEKFQDIEGLDELKTGTAYTVEKDGAVTQQPAGSRGTLKVEGLDWAVYRIVETAPLPGYEDDSVSEEFTISRELPKEYSVGIDGHDVYNDQTVLNIRKVDADDQEMLLPGAVFEVLDQDGLALDPPVEAEAKDGTVQIKGKLTGGTDYILREVKAPEGYELAGDLPFRIEKNGDITVGASVQEDHLITVKDQPLELSLVKTDAYTGKMIDSEAYFALYEGKVSEEHRVGGTIAVRGSVTLNAESLAKKLKIRTEYILVEEKAPVGYLTADEIRFMFDEYGEVAVTDGKYYGEAKGSSLIVKDRPIPPPEPSITPEPSVTPKPSITPDPSVTPEPSITPEPSVTPQPSITPNPSVTPQPSITPNPSVTPEPSITPEPSVMPQPSITPNPSVTPQPSITPEPSVTPEPSITPEPSVTPQPSITPNPSVTPQPSITPNPSVTPEPSITPELSITPEPSMTPEPSITPEPSVTPEPSITPEPSVTPQPSGTPSGKLALTKTLTLDGEEIYARDQTFYVALYSDEALTERVTDITPITFQNACSSTVEFTGLEIGKTYYAAEIEPDGTPVEIGVLSDDTIYMVNFAEGNSAVIENPDGSTTIFFENEFMTLPDGYYKRADLEITKQVLDADGNPLESREVFYAGIFEDEEHTIPSRSVSNYIVPLEMNGDSIASQTVIVELVDVSEVQLYITEVDEAGNPVEGQPDFEYTVSMDTGSVTLTEDNRQAAVTIMNRKKPVTEVTPTPEITPTNPPSGGNTTGNPVTHGNGQRTPARTADDTPTAFYLLLLILSAVTAESIRRRRKAMS